MESPEKDIHIHGKQRKESKPQVMLNNWSFLWRESRSLMREDSPWASCEQKPLLLLLHSLRNGYITDILEK
jgi:hypothetical protein